MSDSSFAVETYFKDLLVIELASVLAGPSVGLFFAECGARVIKIENAQSKGDVTRSWFNSKENTSNISAYFASVNQGKELMLLNLDNEADLFVLEHLLAKADIVISNFNSSTYSLLRLPNDGIWNPSNYVNAFRNLSLVS
jgi:crotonobetainyl-CoA:carnitine CoA-transferase CaiB-like acyl-CoA transferase